MEDIRVEDRELKPECADCPHVKNYEAATEYSSDTIEVVSEYIMSGQMREDVKKLQDELLGGDYIDGPVDTDAVAEFLREDIATEFIDEQQQDVGEMRKDLLWLQTACGGAVELFGYQENRNFKAMICGSKVIGDGEHCTHAHVTIDTSETY